MIYTITLNPALDKTCTIANFTLDSVNRIERMRQDAGGKGINVSKVIAELGGESEAWAILAGHTGSFIEQALKDSGIATHAFWTQGATRTNLKVIDTVLDTHTDINEAGIEVSSEELSCMLNDLCECVHAGDTVVLAGSLPKGAPADTYRSWTSAFAEKGAHVFLDADGESLKLALESKPYAIKPNNFELAELMHIDPHSKTAILHGAQTLLSEGISLVVVSLGSEGALFVSCDEAPFYIPALKVEVGSTVGAGDSVVAALAYGLDAGMTLKDAAVLSQATGAANVMQTGTQPAPRALVDTLLTRVSIEEI